MTERKCCMSWCDRKLDKCMGFTVGRDLVAVLEGKKLSHPLREICGWCREFLYTNPKKIFDELDAQDAEFAKLQPASS